MSFLLLCVATLCSDDVLGVLGNERICWDAAERAESYDIEADGAPCYSVLASSTCETLDASCRGDAVRVRACNVAGCSAWSNPVEVLPFSCLRGESCEEPCWAGAPTRLPHIPQCGVS